MRRALLPAWLILMTTASAGETGGVDFPRWRSGEQAGSVTIEGREEAFVAQVPSGYTAKRKWPVVLLAHGNGGRAADFLRVIRPMADRKLLLVSLERCDNNQDAVGYAPKYLEELERQFAIDPEKVFALGFSGGGFRLWDDIVCKTDILPFIRGVVLIGCGKQSFDPPEKPEKAPTIIFVGDPRDTNYGASRPAAADDLRAKGYEVIVHEHNGGHTVPRKETKEVFAWIAKVCRTRPKR